METKVKQWIAVDLEEYVKLLNTEVCLTRLKTVGITNGNKPDVKEIREVNKDNPFFSILDFENHEHLIHE